MKVCTVLACLFCLLHLCPLRAQQASLDRSTATFVSVPEFLRVGSDGKYAETHVVLVRAGCREAETPPSQKIISPEPVSVVLSGTGTYSLSQKTQGPCTVSFDLKNTSNEYGTVAVTLMQSGKPLGLAFLDYVDPLARRTPSAPQVDVMWAPIGYDTCKRAFGRAVARTFWCIGVKIGNNSGYTLQLAGIGFRGSDSGRPNTQDLTPNSSYALTRAVAQDGTLNDGRNFLLNSVAGLGLMMAGFAPYFHAEGSVARYNTASSIVSGPLQKTIGILWPDHSQLQANNLDDQSLRDNKLIANNTQVTTVVFLDKLSVRLNNSLACKKLFRRSSPEESKLKDEELDTVNVLTMKDHIAAVSAVDAKFFQGCLNGGSSSALKLALGSLVLVGDSIEYRQRIVVDDVSRTEAGPVSAGVKSASVSDDQLRIVAANPDKLPEALIVTANGIDSRANRIGKDGDAVLYTLDRVLGKDASFSVRDTLGTSLLQNIGHVTNSVTAAIQGNQVTIAVKRITKAPEKLTLRVTVAKSVKELEAKLKSGAANSNNEVVYELDETPDAGTTFTIMPKDGFPPNILTGNVGK